MEGLCFSTATCVSLDSHQNHIIVSPLAPVRLKVQTCRRDERHHTGQSLLLGPRRLLGVVKGLPNLVLGPSKFKDQVI
jgi:hypothetical protein